MAARGALEEAAVLLGTARRNLAAHGYPDIWAPNEQRCRDSLGPDRFDRLSDEGSD